MKRYQRMIVELAWVFIFTVLQLFYHKSGHKSDKLLTLFTQSSTIQVCQFLDDFPHLNKLTILIRGKQFLYLRRWEEVDRKQLPLTVRQRKVRPLVVTAAIVVVNVRSGTNIFIFRVSLHRDECREVPPGVAKSKRCPPAETLFP